LPQRRRPGPPGPRDRSSASCRPMNLRYISAWSIRNPIVPIVLFIGLTLAGVVAFSRMDVNDNPDIDFPAVTVNISQPGAAPTEIETQITQKVEAAVRSVNGV